MTNEIWSKLYRDENFRKIQNSKLNERTNLEKCIFESFIIKNKENSGIFVWEASYRDFSVTEISKDKNGVAVFFDTIQETKDHFIKYLINC